MKTLVINNWSGNLTRQNFGDINSGLANFDTSHGYNPFFNPGQLTWFQAPNSVTGAPTGLVLAGVTIADGSGIGTYCVTNDGHFIQIGAEGSSVTDYGAFANKGQGTPTFVYGADVALFGGNYVYISHDQGVTKILLTGITTTSGAQSEVGTWDSTHFTNIPSRRSLCVFDQLLYVTNSDSGSTYANNVAEIGATGLVNNYAKFAFGFGAVYIRDLDVRPDLTYMVLTVSTIPSEQLAPVNDAGNEGAGQSVVFLWNGDTAGSLVADAAYTTGQALPSFGVTALQSFSDRQMMFMYDSFGGALFEGGKKKLTLRNQKSPFPGATGATGNFISFMNPDAYYNLDTATANVYGSLYFYGQLDEESPVGLWRLLRQASSLTGGQVYSVPFAHFTTNRYVGVNSSGATVQVKTSGSMVFSYIDYSGSGGSTVNRLYKFFVAPPDDSPGGWSGAVAGVYQTQTQMFTKKQIVKQIRVYTEPTVANNSFNIDLIASSGKISTNTSADYIYTPGTDQTLIQGSVTRINFNPQMAPDYGIGVRITNTGSANMVINKVELDVEEWGQ